MTRIDEISRVRKKELRDDSSIKNWAMYSDIYKGFSKIKDRKELLELYKKFMGESGRTPRQRDAFTFFYRIRRDELDNIYDLNRVEPKIIHISEKLSP